MQTWVRASLLPYDRNVTYGIRIRHNKAKTGLWRQFLHAWRLGCDHPVDAGRRLDVTSPLPDDLARTLRWAGLQEPSAR